MTAYVIVIRDHTADESKLQMYASLSRLAPVDKMTLVASSKNGRLQTLEGSTPDAVVILSFPSMDDALAWYKSDAYQKALPYRQAAADYRTFLIEGPP